MMEKPIEHVINSSSEINDPDLAKFYSNGFIGGHTNVDVYLLSYMNGKPNILLNMPIGTAKYLHGLLGNIIVGFEERVGVTTIKNK